MDLKQTQGKTYYELLGVPEDASIERIKEVYRDLARLYHPDSNFYDEIVPQKASQDEVQVFKIITAAYNTLVDPEKRAEYDEIINPLKSLRMKSWDSKDDFWTKNDELERLSRHAELGKKETGRKRAMTGTFGRSEFLRAGWDAKSAFDTESAAQQLKPVSEIIKKPLGMRTFILIGMGIGAGIIGVVITLFFLIKK